MRIIVSDSNCVIDLRKASLLTAFLQLPYEILIPNTLFDAELLGLRRKRGRFLQKMSVVDLPSEGVVRARQLARDHPHLSIHDAFAFALAEANPGCILLTGDGGLRGLATKQDITVHGVVWVIDEIHAKELAAIGDILSALRLFTDDITVRLPRRSLATHISGTRTNYEAGPHID
jgi:hypothetical protein